ncbi:MAG: SRPBCC domain-containing protein [Nocardioidaceae bacterium]
MTRQSSFKRLVRTRMTKTGESYTAARAMLLAADERPGAEPPPLATSDASIRERTGRGWEEWFDLLDAHGAAALSHREIARWVAEQLGIQPLVWEAQAVTISYERARRGRVVGERADGFTITASKTIAASADELYDTVVDAGRRRDWIPDDRLRERTATRAKSARYDWDDGPSRVVVTFDVKGPAKTTVVVEHSRLADSAQADGMKAFWRKHLDGLKALTEGGAHDA